MLASSTSLELVVTAWRGDSTDDHWAAGSALQGLSVEHGISGEEPGSSAPYIATGHLVFDSLQAFQTSFASHAQEVMADIPKYTNSEPIVQIGELRL